MNPTLKKILLAFVLILVAALLAALFLMRGAPTKVTAPVVNAPVQSSTTPEDQLEIPLVPVTPTQTVTQKNRNMSTFSMQFVERYGSYSTEGNFQNLKDLLDSMTSGMRARTEATISAGMAPGAEFYGITTKSLSVKVNSSTSTSAQVVVSTRRSETKGSTVRMFNQDATLDLVKSGEEWLVDSLSWVAE